MSALGRKQTVKLAKEYLETQREDLYAALNDSDLFNVRVLEIEHFTETETSPGDDYNI